MTNKLRVGEVTPSKLYYGSIEIGKAYLGDELVYCPAQATAEDKTLSSENMYPQSMAISGNNLYISGNLKHTQPDFFGQDSYIKSSRLHSYSISRKDSAFAGRV